MKAATYFDGFFNFFLAYLLLLYCKDSLRFISEEGQLDNIVGKNEYYEYKILNTIFTRTDYSAKAKNKDFFRGCD